MNEKLPEGWEWAKFGEIADTQLGKMLSKKSKTGVGSRPYLRNQNVQWHRFDLDDVAEMDFTDDETVKYELRPGDLLVCEGGEVGRCAMWTRPAGEMFFQKALHRVRPRSGIHGKWIEYYLRWAADTGRFAAHTSGSTIDHLPQRDLRNLDVPIPPVAEQQRVTTVIDELLCRLDVAEGAVRAAERRRANLHAAAASMAVRGWSKVQLGDISEVYVGSTPSRKRPELWDGPLAWVSSGEVSFCKIRSTRETISREAVKPDRVHPPGTVLLGMIGEGRTRGQAAVLEIPAAHNQNSAAIRPEASRLNSQWLFHVFRATYEANRRVGSGNNQPALNKTRVRQLRIPLPPLEDQQRMSGELDVVDAAASRFGEQLAAALARSQVLRRSILSAAFSGELVPERRPEEGVVAVSADTVEAQLAEKNRQGKLQ